MRHLIDILFLIFCLNDIFIQTVGKKISTSAKHLPAQIKLALQHVKIF